METIEDDIQEANKAAKAALDLADKAVDADTNEDMQAMASVSIAQSLAALTLTLTAFLARAAQENK